MQVTTNVAHALMTAAAVAIRNNNISPVVKLVMNACDKKNAGVKNINAINVKCSGRTRQHIMDQQGIDVWA